MVGSTDDEHARTASRADWADAFARQARSDWRVFLHLSASDLPRCHALHSLQMACEKIAKAYRIREFEADLGEVMKHHVGFVSFIKAFVLMGPIQQEFEGRGARFKQLNRHWSQLAREIELLAPAVDRQRRPDNSEYPWFAGTSVIVPCEYGFPNLLSLTFRDVRGYKFLKLLSRAIDEYETIYRR